MREAFICAGRLPRSNRLREAPLSAGDHISNDVHAGKRALHDVPVERLARKERVAPILIQQGLPV